MQFPGDSVTALEDRMNSIVTELRNKMEEELAETNAREDLLRQDHQHWIKSNEVLYCDSPGKNLKTEFVSCLPRLMRGF